MTDEREIWAGPTTDEDGFPMGNGILVNVHAPDKCAGRACVLHNPSEHHMRAWPMLWRADKKMMERICEHRIGHPDPDDLAYRMLVGDGDVWGVHRCDGCCRP